MTDNYSTTISSFADSQRFLIVLSLPGVYLTEDATQWQKETVEVFRGILQDVVDGQSSTLIIPSDTDENNSRLFTVEIHNYFAANNSNFEIKGN